MTPPESDTGTVVADQSKDQTIASLSKALHMTQVLLLSRPMSEDERLLLDLITLALMDARAPEVE